MACCSTRFTHFPGGSLRLPGLLWIVMMACTASTAHRLAGWKCTRHAPQRLGVASRAPAQQRLPWLLPACSAHAQLPASRGPLLRALTPISAWRSMASACDQSPRKSSGSSCEGYLRRRRQRPATRMSEVAEEGLLQRQCAFLDTPGRQSVAAPSSRASGCKGAGQQVSRAAILPCTALTAAPQPPT